MACNWRASGETVCGFLFLGRPFWTGPVGKYWFGDPLALRNRHKINFNKQTLNKNSINFTWTSKRSPLRSSFRWKWGRNGVDSRWGRPSCRRCHLWTTSLHRKHTWSIRDGKPTPWPSSPARSPKFQPDIAHISSRRTFCTVIKKILENAPIVSTCKILCKNRTTLNQNRKNGMIGIHRTHTVEQITCNNHPCNKCSCLWWSMWARSPMENGIRSIWDKFRAISCLLPGDSTYPVCVLRSLHTLQEPWKPPLKPRLETRPRPLPPAGLSAWRRQCVLKSSLLFDECIRIDFEVVLQCSPNRMILQVEVLKCIGLCNITGCWNWGCFYKHAKFT